jgi:hypothetical protein
MTFQTKKLFYLFLAFMTFIVGYAFLRYAYKVTDAFPFTQEIVLIILGTVATIFITALMLNQQTAVEVDKEQNIMFLDLKTKSYERLLDLLEEMSSVEHFGREALTRLEFTTHRLAIVASADVLNEYNNFLKTIAKISGDGSFLNDGSILSEALSDLTVQIREDLLNESRRPTHYTQEQIKKLISSNSNNSINISG